LKKSQKYSMALMVSFSQGLPVVVIGSTTLLPEIGRRFTKEFEKDSKTGQLIAWQW